MPSYESPLGKRKISAQPMREFDVPDESESPRQFDVDAAIKSGGMRQLNMDEIANFQVRASQAEDDPGTVEREIKAAKEARRRGIERLSEGPRRRIEMLIGMVRSTKTVTIEDNSYVFQTLKSKEMREAILEASKFDGTVQSPFEVRKQLLARSIVQIGGIDIDNFIGSNSLDDKLLFIDELDDILLNRLYSEYVALTKEARDKYSVKNEEEVKEVVGDLKK
jgi:hypothetical protein